MTPQDILNHLRDRTFALSPIEIHEMKSALAARTTTVSPRQLFKYGDEVEWDSEKSGGKVWGTIENFGPKNVMVRVPAGVHPQHPHGAKWRVHPSFLRLRNPKPAATPAIPPCAPIAPGRVGVLPSAMPKNAGAW